VPPYVSRGLKLGKEKGVKKKFRDLWFYRVSFLMPLFGQSCVIPVAGGLVSRSVGFPTYPMGTSMHSIGGEGRLKKKKEKDGHLVKPNALGAPPRADFQ